MAKFVFECPDCGNCIEVKKFSFTKKLVTCGNGHTTEINPSTMVSRECSHCGNPSRADTRCARYRGW